MKIDSFSSKDYLDDLNRSEKEKEKEIGDFGFFTEVIKKLKDIND